MRPAMKSSLRRCSSAPILLALACAGGPAPRPPPPPEDGEVRAVLETARGFVTAASERHFETVWTLLSERWRERTTPAQLGTDFDAEPLAKERLRRAETALERPPAIAGARAELPIDTRRAMVLVREADGRWKIDRLE
jgi:hypothetical protein